MTRLPRSVINDELADLRPVYWPRMSAFRLPERGSQAGLRPAASDAVAAAKGVVLEG